MLAAFLLACANDTNNDSADTRAAEPNPGPVCSTEEDEPWIADVAANVLAQHLVQGEATDEDIAALEQILVELPDSPGPWTDRVQGPWRMELGGSARSELGEEIVAASVPEVVDADGERWMYFVDGDLDQMMRRARANEPMSSGWRGIAGLGAAHLVDGAWERVEPQMNGEELPVLIADPDITRLPDGDWGMVTLAVPFENACVDRLDPADSPAPHRMWGWRSDDLVRWESQGVWWEAPADATDPGLWCRGEACGLVIARGDTPPDGARSDDGAHSFVAEAITGIDPLFVMPDVLVPNEGPLTLLGQGDMGVLRAFTSEDGWTWTGAEAPDFSAAGPTALLADDGWLFWMQVSDLPPSDPPV